MVEPIIRVENLSVIYEPGKTNEVAALKDINLEIFPEEYVIFFGPSGSGKSTMLYVLGGLERPSTGKVIVDKQDVHEFPEKKLMEFHRSTIGIIFQAFYLISSLSVKDNLLLPQIFEGAPHNERIKKMKILAERFGILDRLEKRSNELSGGQQQRVAAARALINDPKIILADEPVGNLDSKNAEITMQLLAELNEKFKKTVILVTHDPRYLQFAHRVFYIEDGKIVRTVRNAERQVSAKTAVQHLSDLEKLSQAYPYLTETRLRAKMILNQLILPFDLDQQRKIEEIIEQFIAHKFTAEEMVKKLDLSADQGGASLYASTARRLGDEVIEVAKELQIVEDTPAHKPSPMQVKVMELRRFLLDDFDGDLEVDQIHKIDLAIMNRLEGKLARADFKKLLDLAAKKGGVGLNTRTARNFSKRLELVLMSRRS